MNREYTKNEQEVLDILDKEGFYGFLRTEGDIEDPIVLEKARLLTLLAFSRIVEVEWDDDNGAYIYHRCHLLNAIDMKVSDAFAKVDPAIISKIEFEMDNPESEKDVLDLTGTHQEKSDDEYEQYLDELINDVVTELDTEEQIDMCLEDQYEDDDWAEKMEILVSLHNNERISLDFCAEHMTFSFKIGERYCEHHPEHNGMTREQILAEKESEDDLLGSQIIH